MPRPRVIRIFLVLSLLALVIPLHAKPPGDEPALGPLIGRNLYAPHLPWYSFPGYRASAGVPGDLEFRTAIYYLNEFSAYPFDPSAEPLRPDGKLTEPGQDYYTALDYESTVWELGVDWQINREWRVGVDWRLHGRYGGFMDPVIEGWHNLFGVPNAGREYFDQGRTQIQILTDRGIAIDTAGPHVTAGDLDLRAQWTGVDRPKWALATTFALKIPTGSRTYGTSSGWFDLAWMLQLDWNPGKRFAFYFQGGLIFPFEAVFDVDATRPSIMFQGIPSVEFRVTEGFSILLQMNIQSSPVSGSAASSPSGAYVHPTFGQTTMFALAQTDLKVGVKGRAGRNRRWLIQFYFEEDLLTWEGPDLVLNLMASYTLPTGKKGK